MSRKRVLVLTNGSLLMASVLQLLRRVNGLEVERVAADEAGVSDAIGHFAPQAVVLDTGGTSAGSELITRLLSALPAARVIALNLDRTEIAVYRTQRVAEASVQGLLEAIQGRNRVLQRRVAEQPRRYYRRTERR